MFWLFVMSYKRNYLVHFNKHKMILLKKIDYISGIKIILKEYYFYSKHFLYNNKVLRHYKIFKTWMHGWFYAKDVLGKLSTENY